MSDNRKSARKSLDELRIELDAIDDAMHDLIMRRAGVVEQVSAAKEHSAGRGVLRPGREARILRRLVERHSGAFPVASIVRIWRELISASVGMQTRFSAGVFRPEPDPGYWDLAREQFGIYAPMKEFASADAALAAVTNGDVTVAVLPMPGAEDDGDWWCGMIGAGDESGAPRIIWHLPFTGFASGPSQRHEALVVGMTAQEDSGDDRSIFVFETRSAGGIADLTKGLKAGGLEPVNWLSHEQGDVSLVLVVFNGFIEPGDTRLAAAAPDTNVHGLGGYPVPFAADALQKAAE